MPQFPRTMVGGLSVSRLVVGTNWFLGYSHTSAAKDKFIKDYQSRERIAQVLGVFQEFGIDTVMGPMSPLLLDAVRLAEDRAGKKLILVLTPAFSLAPDCAREDSPEAAFDFCQQHGATFCLPHQCVTDALLDRRAGVIRDLDRYTRMIRERGMVPGLSTHMPEAIVYADRQLADVETYIQLYNSAGFLMQVEVELGDEGDPRGEETGDGHQAARRRENPAPGRSRVRVGHAARLRPGNGWNDDAR